jgi:hypothetical protein
MRTLCFVISVLVVCVEAYAGTAVYRGTDTDYDMQFTPDESLYTSQGVCLVDVEYSGDTIDFSAPAACMEDGRSSAYVGCPNGTGHELDNEDYMQVFGTDQFTMMCEITDATVAANTVISIYANSEIEGNDTCIGIGSDPGTPTIVAWRGISYDPDYDYTAPFEGFPITLGIDREGDDLILWYDDGSGREDLLTIAAPADDLRPQLVIARLEGAVSMSISSLTLTGGDGVLPLGGGEAEADVGGAHRAGEGDEVTLTCVAEGFDEDTETYQWSKDGEDLEGETGATLTLIDVTGADSGIYGCTVSGTVDGDPVEAEDGHVLMVYPTSEAPLTGIVGLGLMAAACAISGAFVLRRRW